MVEHAALDELDAEPHAVAFEAPRTVRLELPAGEGVAPHRHPDHDVVLVGLEGELTVELDGDEHRLPAGEMLRFDGEREVAPRAETDATALVVLCER